MKLYIKIKLGELIMDQNEFLELAHETLEELFDIINNNFEEVDLDITDDNVLTFSSSDGDYVVNINASKEQIWLSSPISGTYHFSLDEDDGEWVDSDLNNLYDIILKELSGEEYPEGEIE